MTEQRRVAIVGVGYSKVGRHTGLSERHHAAQAATAALEDAGLTVADIDGATTWGGDAIDFAYMLGMGPLRWHLNVGVSPAFITPAVHAAMAVAAGHTDTCVAFRIMMQQPSGAALASGGAMLQAPSMSDAQFMFPFGDFSPTQWAGLLMNRYLYDASLKWPAGTWNKGFFAYQPAPNDRVANTNFWKLQSAKMGTIPMLMDCRWREVYVDKSTEDYYPKNTSDKGMSLIATRRHNRMTNVAFTDMSVKSVQRVSPRRRPRRWRSGMSCFGSPSPVKWRMRRHCSRSTSAAPGTTRPMRNGGAASTPHTKQSGGCDWPRCARSARSSCNCVTRR